MFSRGNCIRRSHGANSCDPLHRPKNTSAFDDILHRYTHRASHAIWMKVQIGTPARGIPQGSVDDRSRSEEHTSELQSLMRISYAVFCLKKKITNNNNSNLQYNQQDNISHIMNLYHK